MARLRWPLSIGVGASKGHIILDGGWSFCYKTFLLQNKGTFYYITKDLDLSVFGFFCHITGIVITSMMTITVADAPLLPLLPLKVSCCLASVCHAVCVSAKPRLHVHRISLGGESNALYPVLSIFQLQWT